MIKYDCFQNKIAVIVGGGSGIGLATAKILLDNDCKVLIVDCKAEALKNTETELGSPNLKTFLVDAADCHKLGSLADFIKNDFGQFDYLVNCVGLSIPGLKGVLDEDVYDRLMDTNAKEVYLSIMMLGYPYLRKGGAIVNTSSIFGRAGTPTFSCGYAAAKAAVINLTKTFAGELAPGIRVNCVAPGPTYPTGISNSWTEDQKQSIAESLPLKRLGKPEEIAATIVFLLSDEAGFITGQTFDVNGGGWMS